ncbi:MAG: sugar transferase [Armatimonadota bacterium]
MSLESLSVPAAYGRSGYQLVKRALDVIGALVLLLILSPVFLLIVICIRVDSPGAIIFRQKRLGLGGRAFVFYKFRSMCIDAEKSKTEILHLNEVSGPIFKIRNDPRVTRVGKFMRRYSLDELPQLFNVLKGDMSFVGPRPPLPDEVEQYEEWQLRRLSVIPGITCLWQISGRSKLSFDEWVNLDLKYIESRSIWLDIIILLKTIPAVISADGAY